MRKPRTLLVLLMLGCLLSLSCGRSLTRETAAKIISEKYGYPKPVVKVVHVGNYYGEIIEKSSDLFQSPVGAELNKYQEAGLIRIENLVISKGFFPATYEADFVVRMTPEGKRYVVEDEPVDPLMDKDYPAVRLCSEVLVEVSGIAISGDKSQATVEFNSRCSDVTPFGKIDGVDEDKLTVHSVKMRLYDDGWRLAP